MLLSFKCSSALGIRWLLRVTGSFARTSAVNLAQDPLGPLNRSRNHGVRTWAPARRPEQIFWRSEVTSDENPCDDRNHSFASFVHPSIVAVSPVLRYRNRVNLMPSALLIRHDAEVRSLTSFLG